MFAQRMSSDASEVGTLIGQIAAMVTEIDWFGADADRFREDGTACDPG